MIHPEKRNTHASFFSFWSGLRPKLLGVRTVLVQKKVQGCPLRYQCVVVFVPALCKQTSLQRPFCVELLAGSVHAARAADGAEMLAYTLNVSTLPTPIESNPELFVTAPWIPCCNALAAFK